MLTTILTFLIWLLAQLLTAYLFFNLQPTAYLKRCFISLDQGFNTIFLFGHEDETLSSRAYRLSQKGKWYHKLLEFSVNTLFFFDYQMGENGKKIRHCELSFLSERKRLQMPPELRDLEKISK